MTQRIDGTNGPVGTVVRQFNDICGCANCIYGDPNIDCKDVPCNCFDRPDGLNVAFAEGPSKPRMFLLTGTRRFPAAPVWAKSFKLHVSVKDQPQVWHSVENLPYDMHVLSGIIAIEFSGLKRTAHK